MADIVEFALADQDVIWMQYILGGGLLGFLIILRDKTEINHPDPRSGLSCSVDIEDIDVKCITQIAFQDRFPGQG